jgi:riboflavin kinase/FMN adenylyltransferase
LQVKNNIKSIAIGSFDGIHKAHKTLIDQVEAMVIIERDGGYLTPGHKRSFFTTKICCYYHFHKIKSLTPEGFVEKLKNDFPNLETIVVGYDFHFGKNKAGNAKMLEVLCDKEVIVVDEVSIDNIPVHSRTIKAYLREGNIKLANKLLGRVHHIDGNVVSGQGLGKKELVPTINLNVKHYQLPLEGVYATRTLIDGEWFDSVSFLGHRVTTDDSYAVETHVIDKEIGSVNGVIKLAFVDFVRENKKFDSLEALREQIHSDIAKAKEILL